MKIEIDGTNDTKGIELRKKGQTIVIVGNFGGQKGTKELIGSIATFKEAFEDGRQVIELGEDGGHHNYIGVRFVDQPPEGGEPQAYIYFSYSRDNILDLITVSKEELMRALTALLP